MPKVTIFVQDKIPQPYRFKLEREIINIGRGSDNDIVIDCTSISTHHSVMQRVEGGYILRDKNSTNGIKQEDTLMEVIDLYHGMEVQVGDTPLTFQLTEKEIEQLSTEDYTPHQQKKLANSAAPKPDIPTSPTPPPVEDHSSFSQPNTKPVSAGMHPMLTLLLMAAAIVGGMAFRHHQDHQELLFLSSSDKGATTTDDQGEQSIEGSKELSEEK